MTKGEIHHLGTTGRIRFGLVAVVVAIALLVVIGAAIPLLAFDSWSTRAYFGDSFGLASTILSAGALFGIIGTLVFQYHELRLLRKEVAAQQRDVRKQRLVVEADALSRLISQLEDRLDSDDHPNPNRLELEIDMTRNLLRSRLEDLAAIQRDDT